MKKFLLSGEKGAYQVKDIYVFEDPTALSSAITKVSWRILELLSEREAYPKEIAENMGVHEQTVYYHIKKLSGAGLVQIVREEERKGATAKYYKASFPAFGVELPFGQKTVDRITTIENKIARFLSPFMKDLKFDGKIVVGAPDPHGPFKVRARDGHYASYLTFFLGQFTRLPDEFVIKLDVDVKAEKEENNNLILMGGPGTNLITYEVNDALPIRFNIMPSDYGFLLGGLVSEKSGKVYTSDSTGIIAEIPNPWKKENRIIVLAGNKAVGTKACVIALTKFWKKALARYDGEERFATVIQGFDLDGDGKADAVEVLE